MVLGSLMSIYGMLIIMYYVCSNDWLAQSNVANVAHNSVI